MSTPIYLLNRCLKKKLKNLTLEESWSRFKPNMSHLRVFGSVSYKHVDGKRDQMILVGYHSIGGFKLYDVVNKRIVIDVTFDDLRDWHHTVTDYQPIVIGYHSGGIVPALFGGPETVTVKSKWKKCENLNKAKKTCMREIARL